ncbi:MAG: polysaccharide deacetylase family protein [Candidatus Aenigmarchaeota archaeon]|nr:polysaccharide deacetylase family protein [Candidatus Aenigmarchaeota archaeon]
MKHMMITIDVEPFVCTSKNNMHYDASYDGLKNLIDLFEDLKIKSTFFVVSEFANKYPKIIREIVNVGHEIASHGEFHFHKYSIMKTIEAKKFLKKSKKTLEKITRKNIIGFRAPQMKHPSYNVLRECGFLYDSSLHPTYIPGYYNNFFSKRKIFKQDNIFIVPISVAPILRAPFSWLWFRNMPLLYSKICTNSCLIDLDFVNIYFHPWEFVDIKTYNLTKLPPKFYIKNTGKDLLKRLKVFINYYKSKAEFLTIKDYLEL